MGDSSDENKANDSPVLDVDFLDDDLGGPPIDIPTTATTTPTPTPTATTTPTSTTTTTTDEAVDDMESSGGSGLGGAPVEFLPPDEDDLMERGASLNDSSHARISVSDDMANPASEAAMESARKFLWDEDEDDDMNQTSFVMPAGTPTHMFNARDYGVDQTVNLMDVNTTDPSAPDRTTSLYSLTNFFKGIGEKDDYGFHDTSTTKGAPRSQEHDEVLKYQARRRQNAPHRNKPRRNPVVSGFLSCWYMTIGLCAMGMETLFYSLHSLCCSPGRRVWLIFLLACVVLIIGITVGFRRSDSDNTGDLTPRSSDGERWNSIYDKLTQALEGDDNDRLITNLDMKSSPEYRALDWLTYSDPAQTNVNDKFLMQRYALAVFYFAAGGASSRWYRKANWMTEAGICNWYGIECTPIENKDSTGADDFFLSQYDDNAMIVGLNMTTNNMEGYIPETFPAFLTELKHFDVSNNRLEGSVPFNFGQFIRDLLLHRNDFSGKIPTELGLLSSLHALHLGRNELEGGIPEEFQSLTALRGLGLDGNHFVGTVPDLSSLSHISYLFLEDNGFAGQFPESILEMSHLIELKLNDNDFMGTIPSEIGLLEKLEVLNLNNNRFWGPIPDMFEEVTRLTQLEIRHNELDGGLPESMGHLKDLRILSLETNKLTGTIPRTWGLMADITTLTLNSNLLSGEIPALLGNMKDLVDLQLHDNGFDGTVPSELSKCYKLEKLYLENNKLTGGIPTQFGTLSQLRTFRIYNNMMNGTAVPEELCSLVADQTLAFLAVDCEEKLECDCCHKCY